MTNKLVYSTDGGRIAEEKKNSYEKSTGPCKMRLETKGRGGKAVTVVFNLPFSEAEAAALQSKLQGYLACGGTFKNNCMEFRGDVREKIEKYFQQQKMKIVRAGG